MSAQNIWFDKDNKILARQTADDIFASYKNTDERCVPEPVSVFDRDTLEHLEFVAASRTRIFQRIYVEVGIQPPPADLVDLLSVETSPLCLRAADEMKNWRTENAELKEALENANKELEAAEMKREAARLAAETERIRLILRRDATERGLRAQLAKGKWWQ